MFKPERHNCNERGCKSYAAYRRINSKWIRIGTFHSKCRGFSPQEEPITAEVPKKMVEDAKQSYPELFKSNGGTMFMAEFIKELDLVTSPILKSYQYHQEYPKEKETLLEKARKALENWKIVYDTQQEYWNKTDQNPTFEQLCRRQQLVEESHIKYKEFTYLALHSVSPEMTELILEAERFREKIQNR